jgi:hypothetical protein
MNSPSDSIGELPTQEENSSTVWYNKPSVSIPLWEMISGEVIPKSAIQYIVGTGQPDTPKKKIINPWGVTRGTVLSAATCLMKMTGEGRVRPRSF